jgi:hypothetical protein
MGIYSGANGSNYCPPFLSKAYAVNHKNHRRVGLTKLAAARKGMGAFCPLCPNFRNPRIL